MWTSSVLQAVAITLVLIDKSGQPATGSCTGVHPNNKNPGNLFSLAGLG